MKCFHQLSWFMTWNCKGRIVTWYLWRKIDHGIKYINLFGRLERTLKSRPNLRSVHLKLSTLFSSRKYNRMASLLITGMDLTKVCWCLFAVKLLNPDWLDWIKPRNKLCCYFCAARLLNSNRRQAILLSQQWVFTD